mmetsp:Transcript_45015/g.86041  ORF Transcript_45015/g.86041 Transcript_45015/m.86041 type:complete len:453 (-) Transcript_45015:287-1645(-)
MCGSWAYLGVDHPGRPRNEETVNAMKSRLRSFQENLQGAWQGFRTTVPNRTDGGPGADAGLAVHSNNAASPAASKESAARFRQPHFSLLAVPSEDALLEILNATRVSLEELRRHCLGGIQEDASGSHHRLRPLVWKVLMNYLPCKPSEWDAELEKKRTEYAIFCDELLAHPNQSSSSDRATERSDGGDAARIDAELVRTDVSAIDHPLSVDTSSDWHTFFKDNEVFDQIDRDVQRTHPDHPFFKGDQEPQVTRRMEMKRALRIFAKLNPGLKYVQGMNEIFAPLYYVFSLDPDAGARTHAEADAFFCFVDLMGSFRDNFCQQLDSTGVGIKASMSALSDLLQQQDPELWEHMMVVTKVHPQFYSFRWITLLLTQEYEFPEMLRVWDFILCNQVENRLRVVQQICCAMLIHVREKLLEGDFATNLKMLQHYPATSEVGIILALSKHFADMAPL